MTTPALPEDFGAVGDGLTDDTAALQSWINSGTKRLRATNGAQYRTTGEIRFAEDDLDVSMAGSMIKPDPSNLTPVIIGDDEDDPNDPNNSSITRMNIRQVVVDRGSTTDLSTENHGFVYRVHNQCTFTDLEARFCRFPHKFEGGKNGAAGGAQQSVHINPRGINGQYNLWLAPTGSAFANENLFLGGRMFDGGDVEEQIRVDGSTRANNNVFMKPSVEGPVPVGIYCNGVGNLFTAPRTESNLSPVIFGPDAQFNHCEAPRFDLFVRDLSANNFNTWNIRRNGFKRENGYNNEPVMQLLRSGSNTAAPSAAKSISGITQNNPAKVHSPGHGLSNGQIVQIRNAGGMTNLNRKFWTVANVTTDHFELEGVDSTNFAAYTSGGYIMTGVPAVLEQDVGSSGFAQCRDEYIGRTIMGGMHRRVIREADGLIQYYEDAQGSVFANNKLLAKGGIGVGNYEDNGVTTGKKDGRIRVFDEAGAAIGYVYVYDS